jgi:hypothetical protein
MDRKRVSESKRRLPAELEMDYRQEKRESISPEILESTHDLSVPNIDFRQRP